MAGLALDRIRRLGKEAERTGSMSKSPSSRTKFVHLRWFSSIVPLAGLAALVACGGPSTASFRSRGGGGGGGVPGAPCTPPSPITSSSGNVAAGVGTTASSTYMDLHVGGSDHLNTVTVPYGSLRLWDTSTGWAQINTASGVYDFSTLDGFVNSAPSGVDLLYNLARTPHWASSNPNDSSCSYNTNDFPNGGGNGQCWAPLDLNSDGSGSNQDWINWVTAVATQNKNVYRDKIKYLEIWNEWNVTKFWQGTSAQLVRMEQDARCVVEGPPAGHSCNSNSSFPGGTGIDSAVRIVTPSAVGAHDKLNEVELDLSNYFGTKVGGVGGGTFSDVIGFHGYVGTQGSSGLCPNPEEVTTVVGDLNNSVLSFTTEAAGKPLFNTEGGWSRASEEGFTDPDRQAAFLARYFLLQRSLGVERVYWYRWDATSTYGGALWTPSTGPTQAASAWTEVSKWINGATLSTACTANGSVWSCGFVRPGGYLSLAVWDAGQDCQNGVCKTKDYTVPAGFTLYLDLTGKSASTSAGSIIQIGAKPILLENGTLP